VNLSRVQSIALKERNDRIENMNLYDLGQLDLSDLPPILHRITSNGHNGTDLFNGVPVAIEQGSCLSGTNFGTKLTICPTSQDDLDEKVT